MSRNISFEPHCTKTPILPTYCYGPGQGAPVSCCCHVFCNTAVFSHFRAVKSSFYTLVSWRLPQQVQNCPLTHSQTGGGLLLRQGVIAGDHIPLVHGIILTTKDPSLINFDKLAVTALILGIGASSK